MAPHSDSHYQFIGDACICWSLGEGIDPRISARVHHLYRAIKHHPGRNALHVLDVVPAYDAVAVHFDPAATSTAQLIRWIQNLAADIPERPQTAQGQTITFRVVYDGEDLERVARHNSLSIDAVIGLHSAGRYTVAMIGFQPHFPYLMGLDKRLTTPRLDTPRTKIPAGAVAIGGAQTGIYPRPSPGGWNLIGMTEIQPLKGLKPGDTVLFDPVDLL